MSAPISDDESSGHQMYASKRLPREQRRIPPTSQLRVDSPRMPPSHAQAQGDPQEAYELPYSGGGLENEVLPTNVRARRRAQPQLRPRGYSGLMLISGSGVHGGTDRVVRRYNEPILARFRYAARC